MSGHWRLRGGSPARLDVQSHPRGVWLVRVERRVLAVPPGLGRALEPLHGQPVDCETLTHRLRTAADFPTAGGAPGAGRFAADDPERAAAAIVVAAWLVAGAEPGGGFGRAARAWPLRCPLVVAGAVRRAAALAAPLASTGGLAFVAAAGLTAAACLRPWEGPSRLSPAALGLFAAGALWHELGHAAALQREGYAPGGIGIGLFVCVPVLYADVSAVRLLPRGGRLRVDLAGLAFQAGAAGALAVAGAAEGVPVAVTAAARAAAVATLLALAWALLPFPRSDGSWAMRDFLETGEQGATDDDPGANGPLYRGLGAGLSIIQHLLAAAACWFLPVRLVGLAAWGLARMGWHLPVPARGAATVALTLLAATWWTTGILRAWHSRRRSRLGPRPGPRYHARRTSAGEDTGGEQCG